MACHLTKANGLLWLPVFCVVGILSSSVNPVEGQRFCGKRLTDTLTLYCDIFPTPRPHNKRQVIEDASDFRRVLFPNFPPEIDDQPNVVDQKYRSVENWKSKPTWMGTHFRMNDDAIYDNDAGTKVNGANDWSIVDRFELGKRGVVDDCCYKSCTLEYLLKNYCG